jgi:hypothetical protein
MVNTVITVSNDINNPGLQRLVDSTKKFKWDIVVINTPWRGFGTKLIETYNYLKANPALESFVFADAHDVVALSDPDEFNSILGPFEDKIITSCEKACWPEEELKWTYPASDSEWKYVNSGTYYAPSSLFIKIFESSPPEYHNDDQLWLTNRYLRQDGDDIQLDCWCYLFQCYSHIHDGDFSYENNRLQNLKTLRQPIFIHGNGRTDMALIDNLLK